MGTGWLPADIPGRAHKIVEDAGRLQLAEVCLFLDVSMRTAVSGNQLAHNLLRVESTTCPVVKITLTLGKEACLPIVQLKASIFTPDKCKSFL